MPVCKRAAPRARCGALATHSWVAPAPASSRATPSERDRSGVLTPKSGHAVGQDENRHDGIARRGILALKILLGSHKSHRHVPVRSVHPLVMPCALIRVTRLEKSRRLCSGGRLQGRGTGIRGRATASRRAAAGGGCESGVGQRRIRDGRAQRGCGNIQAQKPRASRGVCGHSVGDGRKEKYEA